MYLRQYSEEKFLAVLRGVRWSAPSNIYLALFLNNPGETGNPTEISYDGYNRILVDFSTPAFDPVLSLFASKITTNASFAESPTAAGTVTHIGIMDSATGGNMLAYGTLEDSITVAAGKAPQIIENEVVYYSSGNLSNTWKAKLLGAVLNKQSIEAVTPHMALFNGAVEISAANYARMPITFGLPTQDVNQASVTANTADVTFNRASTAWGNFTDRVIMTALTGGEEICRVSGASQSIQKLEIKRFPAGEIRIAVN